MPRLYGWKKGPEDSRDLVFGAGKPVFGLPSSVDLSPLMPPVYDQLNTNTCTGQATAAAIHYAMKFAKMPDFAPSRLFPYYNARVLEESASQDSGAVIRDILKGLNTYGFISEQEWPFQEEKIVNAPPLSIYTNALANRIKLYAMVDNHNLSAVKLALVHGFPLIFGMQVYSGFESEQTAKSGILVYPTAAERLLGGHAVLLCGYDEPTETFLVRNSWGEGWGQKGYFRMPYEYLTGYFCSDFWMLRLSDFYNKPA